MSSESAEHKRIKDLVFERFKEWTGATLVEYPSSGHKLDNFAVSIDGISIYAEIIWSESAQNFYRDMSMVQTADANVKLVIASPRVLENEKYQRTFEKVVISQRRLGFAMHSEMINGKKVIEDHTYLDVEVKGIVLDLLKTVKSQGKVIGKAFEFQPPQPRLPDIREERLFSNLFSVVQYPSIIFSGSTWAEKTQRFSEHLGIELRIIHFFLKTNVSMFLMI